MGKQVQAVRDEDVVLALFARSKRCKAAGDTKAQRVYWLAARHLQMDMEAERLIACELMAQ